MKDEEVEIDYRVQDNSFDAKVSVLPNVIVDEKKKAQVKLVGR